MLEEKQKQAGLDILMLRQFIKGSIRMYYITDNYVSILHVLSWSIVTFLLFYIVYIW